MTVALVSLTMRCQQSEYLCTRYPGKIMNKYPCIYIGRNSSCNYFNIDIILGFGACYYLVAGLLLPVWLWCNFGWYSRPSEFFLDQEFQTCCWLLLYCLPHKHIYTCFLSYRGFYGIAVFLFTYSSTRWNWHLKSDIFFRHSKQRLTEHHEVYNKGESQ